jgi:hypothetical protein
MASKFITLTYQRSKEFGIPYTNQKLLETKNEFSWIGDRLSCNVFEAEGHSSSLRTLYNNIMKPLERAQQKNI